MKRLYKKINKFILSLCGLSTLLSCTSAAITTRKMPEGQLLSVRYSEQGMMAQPEFDYRLHQEPDGSVCCITFSHESNAYEKYRVDSALVDTARNIIKEYKMYAYKDHYSPIMEVLDGYSWGFDAKFVDGSDISSGGNNSGPGNGGLTALRQFFDRAIAEGEFICRSDEDGRPIPMVSDSLMTVEYADIFYGSSNAWTSNVPSFRFYDIKEHADFCRKILGSDSISEDYQSLRTSIEGDRSWGVQVLELKEREPILYLILDDGYVESVPLRNLSEGKNFTTLRSLQHDIVRLEVQTQNDKTIVVGFDKDDHRAVLEWKTIEPRQ